ncbi:IS5 family transposase [Zymobacter palmae]|uniref:IS5 family transposase n=1 Tax=Zymobacter palmae TaxID=33074 RepID=UPI000E741772|nr:IS5 family transposase [Zymobacter palmae]
MATSLLSDELWHIIQPLLPEHTPDPRGGRPRVSDRQALSGILFVLMTGIPWRHLPTSLGFGSGPTCWRRLKEWHEAGVWQQLHHELLQRLHLADRIDWERACVDSSSVKAKKGGSAVGPNPTDRGRPGCKRHVLTDSNGVPLVVLFSGANMHDSVPLTALLEGLPKLQGSRGRPRHRPNKLHADKAYDYTRCREACGVRGITPRIARRGKDSSTTLGRHRWVVERTFAWLNHAKRLAVRCERRLDIYCAFTLLRCAMICFKKLMLGF